MLLGKLEDLGILSNRPRWRRPLLRTPIKGCGMVVGAVEKSTVLFVFCIKANIADERPSRKLTFHRGLEALALQLGIVDSRRGDRSMRVPNQPHQKSPAPSS
jgi:hypothetical protein